MSCRSTCHSAPGQPRDQLLTSMSDPQYTIPLGSKILVTGGNGFIGSHVVDQLLELGYSVRGTVRTPKSWLNKLFDGKYGEGKFETFILPDLTDQTGCDRAVDGISGIIHVAADVSMNPDPSVLIPNAIKATLNLLNAASKHPTIKQVVLTSSSTAAYTPSPNEERIVVTQDTWNDSAVKAAWDEHTPSQAKGYYVYIASKTETERMAFKWVEENGNPFVLNSVLPSITFGKILAPEIRGSTQSFITSILKGDEWPMSMIPPQWYVNVTDVARLHVAALLSPSIRMERVFAFAAPQNWTDVLEILRKLHPDNLVLPQKPENEGRDLSHVVPSERARQILNDFFGRSGWVSLEESIAEGTIDL
ncbi:unnamed protein product [Penicillium olsonii]|nr:unnamed protein product [Penicillium olsonii]